MTLPTIWLLPVIGQRRPFAASSLTPACLQTEGVCPLDAPPRERGGAAETAAPYIGSVAGWDSDRMIEVYTRWVENEEEARAFVQKRFTPYSDK